jgi:stalled ribosome rescue protein Dom34
VAQSVSKEQTADERRKHQSHNFCQMVIKKAAKADSIFIFGPGEAKLELTKEIEKIKGQHDRIAAVETSDRLTENQIIAKVEAFFSVSGNRQLS